MKYKNGCVDSSAILGLLPAAQNFQSQFDSLVQGWSDTLNQMTTEYRDRANSFAIQQNTMTKEMRLRVQQEVDRLQQAILAYREKTVGQVGELDQKREKLMTPIRQRVYQAISEIAKRDGMQFIVDTDKQLPVVVYSDPQFDVTYEVLDLLNRQETN